MRGARIIGIFGIPKIDYLWTPYSYYNGSYYNGNSYYGGFYYYWNYYYYYYHPHHHCYFATSPLGLGRVITSSPMLVLVMLKALTLSSLVRHQMPSRL